MWSSVSALGAAKGGSRDPQPGSRWALQVGPPALGWGHGTRSSVLGGCDLSCPALVAVSTGGLSPKWWGWGRAAAMCRCAAAPWPGSPPPSSPVPCRGHLPWCAPPSEGGVPHPWLCTQQRAGLRGCGEPPAPVPCVGRMRMGAARSPPVPAIPSGPDGKSPASARVLPCSTAGGARASRALQPHGVVQHKLSHVSFSPRTLVSWPCRGATRSSPRPAWGSSCQRPRAPLAAARSVLRQASAAAHLLCISSAADGWRAAKAAPIGARLGGLPPAAASWLPEAAAGLRASAALPGTVPAAPSSPAARAGGAGLGRVLGTGSWRLPAHQLGAATQRCPRAEPWEVSCWRSGAGGYLGVGAAWHQPVAEHRHCQPRVPRCWYPKMCLHGPTWP